MTDLENEIWKPVLDYEDLYEASNLGRVKSIKHGVLKPIDSNGYRRVRLCKNGNKKLFRVHRVVWEAFNGKIEPGLQVNHKDEDKSNNNITNLEVLTAKENIKYGKGYFKRSMAAKKPRKVNQIDLNLNKVIKLWPSLHSAIKAYGVAVRDCVYNAAKTAFGFGWEFA